MWSFRSRLVREVAYGSVLRRRRPAAHRAVAEALLELEPERGRATTPTCWRTTSRRATNRRAAVDAPARGDRAGRERLQPRRRRSTGHAGRCVCATGSPGASATPRRRCCCSASASTSCCSATAPGWRELESAVALLGTSGAPASAVAGLEERVGWYLTADGRARRRRAAPPGGAEVLSSRRRRCTAGVAITRALRRRRPRRPPGGARGGRCASQRPTTRSRRPGPISSPACCCCGPARRSRPRRTSDPRSTSRGARCTAPSPIGAGGGW